MGWKEDSILKNSDADLAECLAQMGGYTKSVSLYDAYEEIFEESEKAPSETEKPVKEPKLAIPKSSSSNKKLTQSQLAKKLLEKAEIYIFQETLYIYDSSYFRPCDRRQLARIMEEILPVSDYEALSVNDFRGLHSYLMECTSDIPRLEDLPLPPGYAYCENGKFDIVSETRLPDSERFLCLHQIKANYEPEYGQDTPVFDQFLSDISGGDVEIQQLIWSVIGYLLIHDPRGKLFVVFAPARNSGKSQLINLIERLIGSEHVAHMDPQRLGGRFSSSALMGCSLNVSADLSSDPMNPDSMSQIKKITGGDTVTCEGKYENPHSMFAVTKFLLASNHPLRITKYDDAFFQRMLVVPFLYSVDPDKQDKDLLEKLWEERDGIVTKALQSVRNVILNNYEFPYCHQSQLMKASWISACFSNIYNFVQDCCDRTDLTAKTSTAQLYSAYQQYCDQREWIAESGNSFSRAITKEFSLKSVRVNSLRGFQGIRLKQNWKNTNVQSFVKVILANPLHENEEDGEM